ncbi:MAG: hypothetical protein KDI43_14140 [Gammaproteobacteria bacterium]|nr:hypothetical protein [Gammaproteobacteria bacterium]
MSLANLTHTDITHNTNATLDLKEWLKRSNEITLIDTHSLLSVAVITGYLLALASLTLASISGGFPWFVVMLIVFAPLYALLAGDDRSY